MDTEKKRKKHESWRAGSEGERVEGRGRRRGRGADTGYSLWRRPVPPPRAKKTEGMGGTPLIIGREGNLR